MKHDPTKLPMTNEEIRREYLEAKDPKAQIRILADENLCSVGRIKDILKSEGVWEPRKYEEREIDIICREFCGVNESEGDNDYYINHNGRLRLKTLLNTYGFDELLYATRVARARYLWRGVQFAFDKIGGICYNRALQRKDGSHGR